MRTSAGGPRTSGGPRLLWRRARAAPALPERRAGGTLPASGVFGWPRPHLSRGESEVHHSCTPGRAALAAAALLASLAAAPAHAQAALIPDTNMSPEIFRFRAEAMQDATDALNTWRTAWERDDVRGLLRLYQKDAL